MKANQKGFSVVEILIVLTVLGLIGGASWYVFQNRNKADNKTNNTQQTAKEDDATAQKIDTTIHEVDIKLQSEADISRLPDYTPGSFKAYMLNLLKNNKSYDNGETTVTSEFRIVK